jgi:hypothetical protein
VNHLARVLEARQNRMASVLDQQVRILDRPFQSRTEGDSENVSQSEIFSGNSPFIVQGRFVGRHQAPAALYILAQLLALSIVQSRDIRHQQYFEAVDLGGIEHSVVNHLEQDAFLDERLIEAERMVLHLLAGLRAAVESSRPLGVNHAHPRDRLLVSQVALPAMAPGVDLLHHGKPARVMDAARDLVKPGPQPVGDPVEHPDGGVTTPIWKMPPMGFDPRVARYSFPFLPFAHGAVAPLRPWRSANRVGAISPTSFMSSPLMAPPPELAM